MLQEKGLSTSRYTFKSRRIAIATCHAYKPIKTVIPASKCWGRTIHSTSSRRINKLRSSSRLLPTISSNKTQNSGLIWDSYLSQKETIQEAVDEAVKKIFKNIGNDAQPTLAYVFSSTYYNSSLNEIIPLLREKVPSLKHIFGCSGFGVLGNGKQGPMEVEGEPGLSLVLSHLPGVDVKVFHTLRSGIPGDDATPEAWADMVGIPHDTSKNVSFLIFADPKFKQVSQLYKGLDYAFPDSPKIGGVLSVGLQSKSRGLFAWTAPSEAAKSTKEDEREAANEAADDSSNGPGSSMFRSIVSYISRLTESGNNKMRSTRAAESVDSDPAASGTYLYGAVVCGLHGDVILEPLVSQGFRCPGERVYRINKVAEYEGNMSSIVSIFPEYSSSSSSSSSPPPTVKLLPSTMVVRGGDDSDSDDENGENDGSVVALTAVVEMLDLLGIADDSMEVDLQNLLENVMLAVCNDASLAEPGPEDYELMPLKQLVDEMGVVMVDGEVRPGYRIKLMVRDDTGMREDLRDKLLRYKRRDLAANLSGNSLPRTFGVLMFTDVDRGIDVFKEESFETRTVASYLPVPICGVFGSAQLGHERSCTTELEFSTVLGVLRATGKS